jgi:hypothetical protein
MLKSTAERRPMRRSRVADPVLLDRGKLIRLKALTGLYTDR